MRSGPTIAMSSALRSIRSKVAEISLSCGLVWRPTAPCTERKVSSGAVFLIFGGHDEKETTGRAHVQLKDGVVVKKWRA